MRMVTALKSTLVFECCALALHKEKSSPPSGPNLLLVQPYSYRVPLGLLTFVVIDT